MSTSAAATGEEALAPRAPVLELRGVSKAYPGGVEALRGVDLTIAHGELVGIAGPSGSGKSTLLHIAGTLERPSAGEVLVDGRDTAELADGELAALRAGSIGFVLQQFFLLDGMSALLALRGGRYGLEVVRAGTATVVEVTPGLYSDGGYVQITPGRVKAGDVVVVPA
jgi:ABC-type phosphate/phosphonate transport system ATPase subunit